MYCGDFSQEYSGDFKDTVKSVIQIPGKVFSTALDPFAKGAGGAISTVAKGAGEGVASVVNPLKMPLLIIGGLALAGGIGFLIFQGQKAKALQNAFQSSVNRTMGV